MDNNRNYYDDLGKSVNNESSASDEKGIDDTHHDKILNKQNLDYNKYNLQTKKYLIRAVAVLIIIFAIVLVGLYFWHIKYDKESIEDIFFEILKTSIAVFGTLFFTKTLSKKSKDLSSK